MTPTEQVTTIQNALKFMASRCDGAKNEDGHGFNGMDAEFGHSLAKQDFWSYKQTHFAYLMLKKYKRQLLIGGFDYDAFVVPTEGECREYRKPKNKKKVAEKLIDLDGDFFVISFPFDDTMREAVKNIPDRKWEDNGKVWLAPTRSSLEVEELAKDHDFIITPTAQKAIDEGRATEESRHAYEAEVIEASKAMDTDIHIPIDGLRNFQKAGVAYLLERRRAFNADEMGTGKTVQALAAIETDLSYPALIIVPNAMKLTWRDEISRWLPNRSFQIIDSKTPFDKTKDITVVNYELIGRREAVFIGEYKALVLDESHFVKNPKAKRTKAIEKIVKSLKSKDPLILMLSGTPLVNRPAELMTQLNIMGRLDDFGGKWHYYKQYCDGDPKGAINLNELNVKLRGTCMVRRLKKDVLTELPPRTFSVNHVDLDNMEEYRKAEAHFLMWLEMMDPDRVAGAMRAEAITRINALRKLAARGKLNNVIDWCGNFMESDGKLVVFGHHSDIVDDIALGLDKFNPRVIKGGVSLNDRQRFVSEFQNDPSVKVMVCSLKAANVGLTLTAASNVAFAELDWTPAGMAQAVDRCHRMGQTDAVNGWQLISEDTIDDYMVRILTEKADIMNQILDGHAPAEAGESILDDLLRLMRS